MGDARPSEVRARRKELYEHICAQIEREDELYQKRINFLIVLNLGLATGAVSQFQYSYRMAFCVLISLFALIMIYSFGSLIYEGKRQLHALKRLYFTEQLKLDFPCPFYAEAGQYEADTPPARRVGRVVREFAIAWLLAFVVSVAVLIHYQFIGRLDG
jgi:hypothetical protein